MILFIDTTDFNGLRLALIDPTGSAKIREISKTLAYNENYKTLAFLETFLKSAKCAPNDLTKIIVCSGPGSFTGIRVGVSLAQAMSFALRIPLLIIKKSQIPADLQLLNRFKITKQTTLNYGAQPTITKPKKK